MIDRSPEISSFIIRFIHAEDSSQFQKGKGSYRGTIRHILSNQELQFTNWKEAVSFIGQFVPIAEKPVIGPPQDSLGLDNPPSDENQSGGRTASG